MSVATNNPLITVQQALQLGTASLKKAGVESAALDMSLILGAALGVERIKIYTDGERPLSVAERAKARELLGRRMKREPLAYILGEREFFGLKFMVRAGVLIPRPETEVLVETVLAWVKGDGKGKGEEEGREIVREDLEEVGGDIGQEVGVGEDDEEKLGDLGDLAAAENVQNYDLRILDIGTGSGAIAVALAKNLPGSRVMATDISEAALQIARENAAALGVAERMEFLLGDGFGALGGEVKDAAQDADAGKLFDVIVSNPPYIPERDGAGLAPEIMRFEPHGALFSGVDGLDMLREILRQAPEWLREGGILAMECGAGQAAGLVAEMELMGCWRGARGVKDLAGIERVVMGELV